MINNKGIVFYEKKSYLLNSEKLHNIVLFILILPIFEPEGINNLSPIIGSIIWGYGRILSAIILSLLFIFTIIRNKRIDGMILCALIFSVVAGIVSVFKTYSLEGWFSRYLCIICSAFLIVVYQKKLVQLLRVISFYLIILIVINFIFVLFYPNGMYESTTYLRYNWLLGYKSSLQYYVIPAITFSWLIAEYSRSRTEKREFFILFVLCITEAALCRNTMLFVGLAIEAICITLHMEKKTSVFNGFTYVLTSFIFNVVILFFVNMILSLSPLQVMLAQLGKDMTFTGRISVIWPKAINQISDSLFFGYGVLTGEENIHLLGNGARSVVHAHNHLLQILLDGGIFLFCIYIIFIFIVVHRMMENKTQRSTQILGISLFVLLIMSTVEIFTRNSGTGMWMIVILCGLSNKLEYQFTKGRVLLDQQ